LCNLEQCAVDVSTRYNTQCLKKRHWRCTL